MQKEQYKTISHHSTRNPVEIASKVNHRTFYDVTELGDEVVEIERLRSVIHLNVPVQIGSVSYTHLTLPTILLV